MNIDKQIKKYRNTLNISQEELADKIYVSRQTISNWETGKSYPDIHSLILMSNLFNVSLDQLIKGDLDIMKDMIQNKDIKEFDFYSKLYAIGLILLIVSIAPLIHFFGNQGFIIIAIIAIIDFILAFKIERFKKAHDIHTYKEIIAFSEGKHLDEITKNQEIGKRPYQKFLLALICGIITFVVSMIIFKILM